MTIHQKRAVRAAKPSVHSVAAHAGSTIAAAFLLEVVDGAGRSPSGFWPTSAGLFLTSNAGGAIPTRTIRPIATQEARQPCVRMMLCSQGSRTIAPTPAPENAMLIARPRRRTNQFGRNWECAV